jgi:predicted PurR-regulated permease PerM
MPPRSPFAVFSSSAAGNQAAVLQGLLIAVVVVAALYFGRDVLLPLALAIWLSFVLTPLLLLLRRIKLPRVLAVAIVVTFAFGLIFALGWLMSRQAAELAESLPRYQQVLTDKINGLRESAASAPILGKITRALESVEQGLANPKPNPTVGYEPPPPENPSDKKPIAVEVREAPPAPFEVYQTLLGTVLPPLATAGIVVLFVIFILLQREDLRDRVIRLMGESDLQRATSTLNDAAERLSRYFLRQVLINAAYGVFVALGLWLIGVPSPAMWGVLAMLMRFVPYVGSFLAAAPPLLLAAVTEPGWTMVLLTGAFFLVSELAMGQLVEPLVFGHGTGLSPIAVVIATVFWTWLWGPLGLILAMPLTVCLLVLGRHVEGLGVFEVLLGDQPALTPQQSFYQRALIGDAGEATYQAELSLREGRPLATYLDEVALKGLLLAERDAERGALDVDNLERIEATIAEIMDDLADFEPKRWFGKAKRAPEADEGDEPQAGLATLSTAEQGEAEPLPVLDRNDLAPGWLGEEGKESILCIGARTALEDAAAVMLATLLNKHGLNARAVGSEALSAAHIASLPAAEPKLVCLSYLGIGSSAAQVRYLVRRLRRILPAGTAVLVGYWPGEGNAGMVKALEATAGADAYATSLKEAVAFCLNAARGNLPAAEAESPGARVA